MVMMSKRIELHQNSPGWRLELSEFDGDVIKSCLFHWLDCFFRGKLSPNRFYYRCYALCFRIVCTRGLVGFFQFLFLFRWSGFDFVVRAGPGKSTFEKWFLLETCHKNCRLVPALGLGFLFGSFQLASEINREQEGCNSNRNYDYNFSSKVNTNDKNANEKYLFCFGNKG